MNIYSFVEESFNLSKFPFTSLAKLLAIRKHLMKITNAISFPLEKLGSKVLRNLKTTYTKQSEEGSMLKTVDKPRFITCSERKF